LHAGANIRNCRIKENLTPMNADESRMNAEDRIAQTAGVHLRLVFDFAHRGEYSHLKR
jgi:hypothetical protein